MPVSVAVKDQILWRRTLKGSSWRHDVQPLVLRVVAQVVNLAQFVLTARYLTWNDAPDGWDCKYNTVL